MVDTNWGLVADDRVNDNLDFSQIHTQEDYDKAVRDFLKNTPDRYGNYKGRNILKARKRSPEDIIDEMYDESKAKDRSELIEGLMDALLNDKSKAVIGKLIVESMKDYFDKGQVPPGIEFMNTIPATSIVGLLTGVAKANKGVLGPLAESLTGLWAKAKMKLDSALASENDESATSDEASSPTEDTPASQSPEVATPAA